MIPSPKAPRFTQLFMLLVWPALLAGCYLPKEKVEGDIHPDVPLFPACGGGTGITIARVPVPLYSTSSLQVYDAQNRWLFIYQKNTPVADSTGNYKDTATLYVVQDGLIKSHVVHAVKNSFSFFEGEQDASGNVYFSTVKYIAPGFSARQELPVVDVQETDQERAGQQPAGAGRQMRSIHPFSDSLLAAISSCFYFEKKPAHYSDLSGSTLLCNFPGSGAFIAITGYGSDTSLLRQAFGHWKDPMLKPLPGARSSTLYDDSGLIQTEKSVMKNVPYHNQGGNHMVGDPFFGNDQWYMRYYTLKLPKGRKIYFKTDDSSSSISLFRTATGIYLNRWNRSSDKNELYFLKF